MRKFRRFKKDDKTDRNNHRPISILPVIAKVSGKNYLQSM